MADETTGGGETTPFYAAEGFGLDVAGEHKAMAEFIEGKGFTDVPAMLKSHMEADRLLRDRGMIERPNPEKLGEWKGWTELGWKENADDYVFGDPEGLPEGFQYDKTMEDNLRKIAHEERVPLATAQKLRNALLKHQADQVEQIRQAGARDEQEMTAALQEAWGADRERNTETARRAFQAFAEKAGVNRDQVAELNRAIGNAPMLKMFHAIGQLMGEQALPPGSGGGAGGLPTTIAGVRAEMNRFEDENRKIIGDRSHPRHKDVMASRQKLLTRLAELEAKP